MYTEYRAAVKGPLAPVVKLSRSDVSVLHRFHTRV